jgi:hypothetical protein
MFTHRHTLAAAISAIGALALVVGCSKPTPASPSVATGGNLALTQQAELGKFEVCKQYAGTVGPTVTFNVVIDVNNDGTIESNTNIQLANGQCQEVWLAPTDFANATITVTETVPSGYTASYVKTTMTLPNTVTVGSPVSSNTITAPAGNQTGVLVVFTNTGIPTGGEGCTPGYWKQGHHFDSWTAPYTPDTLFDDVFENAFPGLTLLDVLKLQGGGLEALGRHTVAALLNAASGNVSYPLTVSDVINGFNAVFPGGNYETLKDRWAALNEAGCPLN